MTSSSISPIRKVALIVETNHGAGRQILGGISRYMRENSLWSLYHEPRALDTRVPAWLQDWQGDGIIARIQNREIANAVLSTGLPVIDVLGNVPGVDAPLIHVDDKAIAALAAEHLVERGFRNFACFAFSNVVSSINRYEAFLSLVEAWGFKCELLKVKEQVGARSSWQKQQEQISKWLKQLPKPTGLFVICDHLAQRLLESARASSIVVPEEVAVLGVGNDLSICEVCFPPLSSVAGNHEGVGYEAARMLDRMMTGTTPPTGPTFIEPLEVMTRQSTDVIAVDDPEVASALSYIRNHACDGIKVEDVVLHTLLSRATLKRRFRERLDSSIQQQINRVRISRIKMLLVESSLSIGVISERTGFTQQDYLTQFFRKNTGTTPTEYRQRYRGL